MKLRNALVFMLIAVLLTGCSPSRKNACLDCGSNLQDCAWCDATGKCEDCDAEGNHICNHCNGNPKCIFCTDGSCDVCADKDGYAAALTNCVSCKGSARCARCDGTGIRYAANSVTTCFSCNGNGVCSNCDGKGSYRSQGSKKCISCDGTMLCHFCGGDQLRCETCVNGKIPCENNGQCHKCNGAGKLCHPCNNIVTPGSSVTPGNSWIDFGTCENCFGAGTQKCFTCVTGSCINCGGDGSIANYASGDIKYSDCFACTGGRCSACGGTGSVDCPYC